MDSKVSLNDTNKLGRRAFPPEFTTVIPLQESVAGFVHDFSGKRLSVFLLKGKGLHGERVYR